MLKTKFILFFSILFLFSNPMILSADSDSDLKVLTIRADVDFPNKITFIFEGITEKKIQDIKVNFKTGDRKSLQYGYMDFKTSEDKKVTAYMDFRISNQGGYIPPGSHIDWHVVIYFDDGTQYISEDNDFIMLDTRFDDWEFVEGDFMRVYYRFSKSRAEKLLSECEQLMLDMAPIIDKSSSSEFKKINMTLYNNYSEMLEAIQSKSKTSDRELITAGQAFDESSVVIVLAGKNDIGTSTHEIMHILIGRKTDGSINLPLWLNEGLAEYANRDKTVSYDLYLEWAIGTNQLKPLSQLRSFPGDPKLTLVAYGQSRSVINYMIENFGQEKMNLLLTNISDGKTLDEAMENSYGFDTQELDSQWRKSIGAGPYNPRQNETITVKKINPVIDGSCRSSNLLVLSLGMLFLVYISSVSLFTLFDRR
tara:strand:+ start:7645 stop:8910 length:1266 start_codon:yes stop_codon:yes gene_type:complete